MMTMMTSSSHHDSVVVGVVGGEVGWCTGCGGLTSHPGGTE